MNGDRLDELLTRVPLDKRADAREFALMPADEQRFWLYVEVRRQHSGWRAHIAQAGYTTVGFGAAVAYILSGGRIGG